MKRLQLVAQVFVNALARARHEVSLREGEARLAAGADLAGLAFYEVDLGERTVFVDDRFSDVCGIPPEAQHGLGVLEFWIEHLHPEDRQHVLDQRKSSCTTAGWRRSRSSIATGTRPVERGGFITWPASPGATPPDGRSRRSAFCATSPRDGNARRP